MKTKRVAWIGMLVALAMILSYIESLIPVFVAVPGMKLGLTNLVVLVALVALDVRYAFFINLVRIVLVAFTFGNAFSMMYSLAGGMLSLLVMLLCYRSNKFSLLGVSVAGGVAHNAGQILVAAFVLETGLVLYYLPILCISGVVAGAVIGIIGGNVLQRLPKNIFAKGETDGKQK